MRWNLRLGDRGVGNVCSEVLLLRELINSLDSIFSPGLVNSKNAVVHQIDLGFCGLEYMRVACSTPCLAAPVRQLPNLTDLNYDECRRVFTSMHLGLVANNPCPSRSYMNSHYPIQASNYGHDWFSCCFMNH